MATQRFFKLCFLTCVMFFFSAVSYAVTLQNGVAYQTSLEPLNINQVDFTVPPNTESFTVTITGGSGDLDLYLKFGRSVAGSTVGEIDADADAKSIEATANESITLNSSSTPVLKEGTWFISVLNWNDSATTFSITATIKAKAAPAPTPGPVSTGGGGIPAAAFITDGDDITVIGMNFSDVFEIEDIEELQTMAESLLTQLGGEQDAFQAFPPDVILGLGYNGDQFHSLAVSVLPSLKAYYQVKATRQGDDETGIIRLEIYLWDSEFPSGTYMGGFEIAQEPPLMQMLGIISTGTRFIKIKSIESVTVGGDEFIRIELYFQESATSEGLFLATIEVAGAAIQKVFAQLQSDD